MKSLIPYPRRLIKHLIIVSAVIVAGCVYDSNLIAPSDEQIQRFIAREQILPITGKTLDQFSILIGRQEEHIGCYVVSSDSQGEVQGGFLGFTRHMPQNNPQTQPISVLYSSHYEHEIVCLTINDQELRSQAQFVKVVFYDGDEVTLPLEDQEGIIIARYTTTTHSQYQQITLYDQDNNELLVRKP